MTEIWKDDQPIYRQLHERMLGLIMQGVYTEGEAIPSVRQVASDLRINHLTVGKAYQELVDMGLVESRRGMGMYVLPGARAKIYQLEKEKFLTSELPALLTRIQQLGIEKEELFQRINSMHEEQ